MDLKALYTKAQKAVSLLKIKIRQKNYQGLP